MNKKLLRFSIFAAILIAIWIIAKITGVFQSYKIPSGAMEPTIKMGSRFFASNLKKPKRNSIIIYKKIATEMIDGPERAGQKFNYVHRLIAFGGETIEIKNDLAYVNGKLVDDSSHLQFPYNIIKEDFVKVADILKIDLADSESFYLYVPSTTGKHYIMYLSLQELNKVKKVTNPERIIADPNDSPKQLYNPDSKKWTISNYGPFKIPKDHYFILGDNRHLSADSRFCGPIPSDDWVGTVLWKK